MQTGWRIGFLFGIPLYIDPSWLYVLAIFTVLNSQSLQSQYPHWQPMLIWVIGLLMTLLLFASVLLHELGHSLTAISQGIKVNSITLFLFGGVAAIERESKTPGQAFQVAIAGPAVSITIFLLISVLNQQFSFPAPVKALAEDVADINLILGLFNLIPGLPLDGGQVLKAAVWKITGNRFSGVRWAAKSGLFLGWSAITLGLAEILMSGNIGGGLWIILLGWFVTRNARQYTQITNLQEALLQIVAAEVMTRDFRVVDAEMTLRQFADDYILTDTQRFEFVSLVYPYYAASNGRYRGLICVDDLQFIERSRWENNRVSSIVHSLDKIVTVQEKTNLVEVINYLEANQLKHITVLSPAGSIAGVIDKGDIVRFIAKKLNFPMSEAEITRIKAEGTYPPGFQLQAIAKSAIL